MKDAFCDPKTGFIIFALRSIKYTTCMYPQMPVWITF